MHIHLFGGKYLHFRVCQNYIALLEQMVCFKLLKYFLIEENSFTSICLGANIRTLELAKVTLLLDASADADILEQEL